MHVTYLIQATYSIWTGWISFCIHLHYLHEEAVCSAFPFLLMCFQNISSVCFQEYKALKVPPVPVPIYHHDNLWNIACVNSL